MRTTALYYFLKEHLLLIHRPDESGLIAKITGVVFQHGLNIISNAEFVERKDDRWHYRWLLRNAVNSFTVRSCSFFNTR